MKIRLNEGQSLWFTSDTHFNHANICSATTKWIDPVTCRQFDSLEDMNDTLVQNINDIVSQDDILIHLGDWSFGGLEQIERFRNQIACKNIHIVTGNHDHHIENNKDNCQRLFSSVNKYLNLTVYWEYDNLQYEQRFALMHFPLASWDQMAMGSIHLHGHVHFESDKRLGPGKMMDVGVDGNDLQPIGLTEVWDIMANRPIKSMFNFDHHEKVENYKK